MVSELTLIQGRRYAKIRGTRIWTFWLKSRASQLPNGGFGLKIGPLLRELRPFKRFKVLLFNPKFCRLRRFWPYLT